MEVYINQVGVVGIMRGRQLYRFMAENVVGSSEIMFAIWSMCRGDDANNKAT